MKFRSLREAGVGKGASVATRDQIALQIRQLITEFEIEEFRGDQGKNQQILCYLRMARDLLEDD